MEDNIELRDFMIDTLQQHFIIEQAPDGVVALEILKDKNIDLINQIPNIEKVEPMTHCLDDFEYELREDEVEDSIDIEDLLSNCDVCTDREVEVPKVVG